VALETGSVGQGTNREGRDHDNVTSSTMRRRETLGAVLACDLQRVDLGSVAAVCASSSSTSSATLVS
jgi:hypothetical protein